MGGCMGQWVGSGQMTNLIKLELINIIWFCLKIYNLSRHPYLWVDGWVNGWAHVKPLKSNKSWPNRDNSIMDILDILLDILLKPPQPFIGLFLHLKLERVVKWKTKKQNMKGKIPGLLYVFEVGKRNAKNKKSSQFWTCIFLSEPVSESPLWIVRLLVVEVVVPSRGVVLWSMLNFTLSTCQY